MANVSLSEGTKARLDTLFAESDRDEAQQLLAEFCGEGLPLVDRPTPSSLERIRFAALKLSGGELGELCKAIELAHTDWRDLLVAAGFANDTEAHHAWFPDEPAVQRRWP